MAINPAGNGSMIMSIADQETALQAAELQNRVDTAVLSEALDAQKQMATELLQTLGIGQNLDIEA